MLDKGEAGGDAGVLQLVLEMLRQVLGAVVQPQGQSRAGVRGNCAPACQQPL